jgi:hypothetical protein
VRLEIEHGGTGHRHGPLAAGIHLRDAGDNNGGNDDSAGRGVSSVRVQNLATDNEGGLITVRLHVQNPGNHGQGGEFAGEVQPGREITFVCQGGAEGNGAPPAEAVEENNTNWGWE